MLFLKGNYKLKNEQSGMIDHFFPLNDYQGGRISEPPEGLHKVVSYLLLRSPLYPKISTPKV